MADEKYDVSSLMEMGIDKEVALDAMRRVNGNLADAVNFIFSNELPPEPMDSVPISLDTPLPADIGGQNAAPALPQRNFDAGPIALPDESRPLVQFTPSSSGTSSSSSASMDSTHAISAETDPASRNSSTNDSNATPLVSLQTYTASDRDVSMQSTETTTSPRFDPPQLQNNSDSSSSNESEGDVNILVRDDYDAEDAPPSYSVMQHSVKKREISDPTIVMPIPLNSLIENYLALFTLAVANYAPTQFLKPDFKNLNYDRNWYKGTSRKDPLYHLKYPQGNASTGGEIVEAASDPDEESQYQPETLWQLQRLIATSDSKFSERAFVSAKLIINSFNSDVQQKLGEVDYLYEILPAFMKSLATDLEMCKGTDADVINNTFVSSALYRTSTDGPLKETHISLFHFLPDEYDVTLYKMFNVLLFPTDVTTSEPDEDSAPDNSLKEVAPFITVIFNALDETTDTDRSVPNGVQVPFEFYPQIYTKKSKDQLIEHIIDKRREGHFQMRSLMNDLNKLKSYQGKDIRKILESTVNYLKKEVEQSSTPKETEAQILQQVQNVIAQIEQETRNKNEEFNKLSQQMHKEWNLIHPELHVIDTAKQLGLIDHPYLLTMVAITPSFYFMRDKRDKSKWTQVKCNRLSTDFQVTRNLEEAQVQEVIAQYTISPSETPIMFTYVKEDFYDMQMTEVTKAFENNEGCQQFHKADQLDLLSNN